ncbi:UDP-N-acetylmuramate--L-alanine ligase [Flavobacteriaceae bacterium UJ101]|nr:UDP-N-acetylmuramate--L-alanine ligase [Flavobacteriaceae bacterium UJ101]
MDLKKIHNVYFIGIGGIGMSALARYFKSIGKEIFGYDRTSTVLTQELESEGIHITYKDLIETIPEEIVIENSLVVYTPAIPENHIQKNELIKQGFSLYKRSEVLGLITENTTCLAVAGTHGKTSTTSLLGHILHENQVKSTAFLGGICENYNSNLILGGNEYSVVEADEFDRSFLKLSPNVMAITSMDADHLDIYGEHAALEKSFQDFVNKLPEDGVLITKKGLPIQGITYAIEEEADFIAKNIRIERGAFVFDVWNKENLYTDFKLYLPGRHNIENALAAIAVALETGLDFNQIKKGIQSFQGIKRRFSIHHNKEVVYIDDYAHHPTELNAAFNAVREMFPYKKLLTVFQPHLFSRTQDFVEDFAKSLEQVDELILMDIYPARELPIEGVTSEWLLSKIEIEKKEIGTLKNTLKKIKEKEFDVLLTVGAGNIDTLVEPIKKWLKNER